ncbi:MAG: spermidine synthase [Rhodospirillaceae bacterium]|nr:spermidine synthase [Rhodospirillaceae bacterium]|tara:strand:- start:966 stop:1820 length:855 start_codon:yes stop_codon:yes gene_type:complete
MKTWSETLEPTDFTATYKVSRMLYEERSSHQHVMLFENAIMGRVLVLDGIVQTTEKDEFIYHEMIVHVPVLAHGAARRVLIIGGGDGGALEELFKHQSIEHATLVDIDHKVIELSQRFLGTICGQAFADPRLDLVIADGRKFVSETEAHYDIVIVDSPDPIGPGAALFTTDFYRDCRRCLTPGGVLVTQNGVPFTQSEELRDSMTALKSIFADARCYLTNVPSYIGGTLALGWATDDDKLWQTPVEDLQDRFEHSAIATRYYTPALQSASFALPGFITELIVSC